jgi:hypothetical protein
MAAVLITLWLTANGISTTQSIEMISLDACRLARSLLIEATKPLLYEGSFLEDVQFECQERGTRSASSYPSPAQIDRRTGNAIEHR